MATGIKVKDAMVNRVVTARPEQTVLEGSKIMKKEGVGSLIICSGKEPIGIVTREDIVNKITAKDLMSSKILLKDIMTSNVITCTPDHDISEAAALMSKHKYERLPVISMGKLIGIISSREIAKVAPSALEVLTEHLRIEEPTQAFEETTSGECQICGNYSEELKNVNDTWMCESCREESAEL